MQVKHSQHREFAEANHWPFIQNNIVLKALLTSTSLGQGWYFRKVTAAQCLLPQPGQISLLQTEVTTEAAEKKMRKIKQISPRLLRKKHKLKLLIINRIKSWYIRSHFLYHCSIKILGIRPWNVCPMYAAGKRAQVPKATLQNSLNNIHASDCT